MDDHALTLTRRYDGYFIASFAGIPEATACGRDSEEAIEEAAKALQAALGRSAFPGRNGSPSASERALLVASDELPH